MSSSKRRLKNFVILTVIIILCLIIITVSSKESDFINKVKIATLDFFKPIQQKANYIFNPVKGLINSSGDYFNLRDKVRGLERENAALRKDYTENINLKVENNSLRKLLEMKLRCESEVVHARVIGYNEDKWQSEIVLNVGTNDGILEGTGVINEKGLIGIVIFCANNSCRVRLIDDPQSSIGARILSSRQIGIIEGAADKSIYLNYIPKQEIMFKGDIVITSESSSLLPGGILIGRVKKVTENTGAPYKNIEIFPFVDFRDLDNVLVIK